MANEAVQSNTQPAGSVAVSEIRKKKDKFDTYAIIASKYPERVEDYAVHLYYKWRRFNPNFVVYGQKAFNNEEVSLLVDNKTVRVNVRTGKVEETVSLS